MGQMLPVEGRHGAGSFIIRTEFDVYAAAVSVSDPIRHQLQVIHKDNWLVVQTVQESLEAFIGQLPISRAFPIMMVRKSLAEHPIPLIDRFLFEVF